MFMFFTDLLLLKKRHFRRVSGIIFAPYSRKVPYKKETLADMNKKYETVR